MTRADSLKSVSAKQDATSVRVTVLLSRQKGGTYPLDLLFVPVTLMLERALGDRAVLDGKGDPIPLRRP